MAEQYKVLAQNEPTATTLTDAYTASGDGALISTIVVCNRDPTATTVRISVAVAGAADSNEQYIVYDAPVNANDSTFLTIGATLAATDVLRVYSDSGNVAFNVFGAEL